MDSSLFQSNLVRSNRILYTPSPFAKSNLLHLQETGELEATEPHISRREGLSSYLFFIVLKGSGRFEYGGTAYPLSTGHCAFIDCRKAHLHQSSSNLWTLKWAHFHGPNMNAIYEKYVERGGAPCFLSLQPDAYRNVLDELFRIAASNSYVRDMKICEKLTALLALLMEEAWDPAIHANSSAKRQNLQAVKDYLDQNYAQKITLDELSERFFINKFYLSKIFTEQFGATVGNYLIQVRITHAKQLLRFTDFPIERIAVECGIPDPNYFSRLFRKTEGIPPGEFRKQW